MEIRWKVKLSINHLIDIHAIKNGHEFGGDRNIETTEWSKWVSLEYSEQLGHPQGDPHPNRMPEQNQASE